MRLARIVFFMAGLWGIAVLVPLYFRYDALVEPGPPAASHPEFYYAFLAVALAWQGAFFVIAGDPLRFRPVMVAAILEKLLYAATIGALYVQGRLAAGDFTAGAVVDLVLGALFVLAFVSTSGARPVDAPR